MGDSYICNWFYLVFLFKLLRTTISVATTVNILNTSNYYKQEILCEVSEHNQNMASSD